PPRREARGARRRHRDRLPADLPDAGHHVRQSQRRDEPSGQAVARAARLSRARRDRHPPERHLSEEGRARSVRVDAARREAAGMRPGWGCPPRPIAGGAAIAEPTFADVNRDVLATLRPPGSLYFGWMCVVGLFLTCGILAWSYQIWMGMGAAGKRTPQMWAMYITTFVFWIGIGHAGTLISAVLYLFRARWRTSIYRAAEAMTIFAVLTAGLFPMIDAGRAARAVRAQRGVVGLRDGARPRLALDAVRAVLRRRRDLLGLRDGAGPGAADAVLLRAGRLHPRSPPRRDGQADPGHRAGPDVLLHLRAVHVLVQRGSHREGLAVLAADRVVCVGAGHDVLLQLHLAADPLLEESQDESGHSLRRVDPRAHRDVVRALQHHRAFSGPRLLPVHLVRLRPDHHRHHHHHRQLRVVLHPVPGLHQGDAVAVDRGGEGNYRGPDEGHPACRPPLRRSSASSPT